MSLSGCVGLGIAAGAGASFGGGYLAGLTTSQPYVDTEVALKVADPAVTELCRVEPWKPHSKIAQDAIKAFCDNIPSDPVALLKQIAVVNTVVAADLLFHQGRSTTP